MTKPVVVHAAARQEYFATIDWYDEQEPGLGARFADAVEKAMAGLQPLTQHAPETVVRRGPSVRRAPVRDFPYRIVAADLPEVVLVVAYAHRSQRPGYWLGRLEDAPPPASPPPA